MKYAIAVLLREKITVVMWRGTTKYTFLLREQDFRGKEFGFIDLKRQRGLFFKTTELPFTTELGKNWGLWQAFRELESNTRDENGETLIADIQGEHINDVTQALDDSDVFARKIDNNTTYIVVEDERFVQEYLEKDKTFLPDGLREQSEESGPIQLIKKPSTCIYWRGMRVYDLPKNKPSIYTWNVLAPVELTEDRTLASYYTVEWMIQGYVAEKLDKNTVKEIIKAPEKTFEAKFDYSYTYSAPSEDFVAASEEAKVPPHSYAGAYVSRYKEPEPKEVLKDEDLIEALIMAISSGDWDRVKEVIDMNRDYIVDCLKHGQAAKDAHEAFPYVPEETEFPIEEHPINAVVEVEAQFTKPFKKDEDEEIPF